jgi:hypothetical protein
MEKTMHALTGGRQNSRAAYLACSPIFYGIVLEQDL